MDYINTATHTPTTRWQIKQDNPSVSLPADPSALQLALLGYAIIEPVEPPEGDVVEPGVPEHYATDNGTHTYEVEVEREVEVENEEGETVLETETAIEERSEEVEIQRWRQTWISRDFTPEELAEQLDQRKQERAGEIDAFRDGAFDLGMPYEFSDGVDVVQIRQQDQINLMGLAAKAQRQLVEGDDTPLPFRALSNQTRMLTPAEIDAMALAALACIEDLYGRTWQAKDAIEAAETLEELEAVQW